MRPAQWIAILLFTGGILVSLTGIGIIVGIPAIILGILVALGSLVLERMDDLKRGELE